MVGYYPFNGNANDESGNSNNGKVTSASLTSDRFGNVNSAYSFVNSSDNITVSNLNDFNTDGYSISVWAKLSASTDGGILVHLRNLGGDEASVRYRSTVEYDACSGNNGGSCLSSNSSLDSKWQHITATFDLKTNETKIYVNGSLKNSSSSAVQAISSAVMSFGTHVTGITPIEGELDDIRIYNRALNECEVISLYNESDSKVKITVQDTLNIYLSQIITTVYEASLAATTVKVYPNPSQKNLTVEIDNPSNLNGITIKVLDAQSAEVHNEMVTGSTQSIDVSSWSAGVYFLHVINGTTTVDIRKIVVHN